MTSPLAQYAVSETNSRGRTHSEPPHPYRGAFERDRDRVIHSAAFRRLEGKTQVFTPGLNDQYRTRMSHTIEVAQVGRTIARVLNLNEPLTEAICLAHDLGHAPFGHTGEHVLNELMADFGGFEHNLQTLRIVEMIECPYPSFRGLNLMFETRLGLIRHSSPYDAPADDSGWPKRASLEGQIADIADRIAYNCHDLEDGLRSRLIDEKDLAELTMYQRAREQANIDDVTDYVIRRTRLAKSMLDILVRDAIETSQTNLASANIKTLEDVYQSDRPLIGVSEETDTALRTLEAFLMGRVYRHPNLEAADRQLRKGFISLFDQLRANPEKMPSYYQQMIPDQGIERTVCDYIAGMTDRYWMQMIKQV